MEQQPPREKILDAIISNKRQEVAALKDRLDEKKVAALARQLPPPRRFSAGLPRGKMALIAELKRASPSAGRIAEKFEPVFLAKAYEEGGAAALSVVTDAMFFQGKIEYIKQAKESTTIPVLRKDFIIDAAQIYESRVAGADALLLIVRILSDAQLSGFLKLCGELGMAALVEVHDESETERALNSGAELIGINNRDLDTFSVDLQTTLKLMDACPELKKKTIVSESGITDAEQVRRLRDAGVCAVLVGESLLRSRDVGAKIRELLCAVMLLCCCGTSVFAMGEIPSTTEVVNPTVEYVREFGLPGSGERQFYYPQDVKASIIGDMETGLGNLFIADTGNNRIQRLDQDGGFVYQFGGFGNGDGKFNTPVGIAVDYNFQIYVSEKDNNRIQLFDIRGNFLTEVATGDIKYRALLEPAGMDVDALGFLYVADSGNDRILKFDSTGNFIAEIGGFGVGSGFLSRPLDVALDRDRNIYVSDTGNNRVQKYDIDGRPLFSFGDFSRPHGIAVDDKFIYVSDRGNDRICIYTKKGELVLSFGRKGFGQGEFNEPMGISFGRKGQLYVVDSSNHRIQELKVRY